MLKREVGPNRYFFDNSSETADFKEGLDVWVKDKRTLIKTNQFVCITQTLSEF